MADGSRKLVNLQVNEEQKTRWTEHVENSNEHKSLSQFIRFVVEREIGSDTPQGSGGLGEGADEQLNGLQEDNRQLRANLQKVAETVERIEDRMDEPSGEIRELASDIFGVLPERDLVVDGEGNPRLSHGFGLPDEQNKAYEGTAESVANIMDTDEYRALQALDLLERDMSMVRSREVYDDGVTRYYKDELAYPEAEQ
jgi:hypothetical protein